MGRPQESGWDRGYLRRGSWQSLGKREGHKGGSTRDRVCLGAAVHKHVCVCGSHGRAEVRGVRKRWGQLQDLNPRGAGGPRL